MQLTRFQAYRIAITEYGRLFTAESLVAHMEQANSYDGQLVHDRLTPDARKAHWPNDPATGLWDARRAFRGYLQEEVRCVNAEAAEYATRRYYECA